MEKKCKWKCFPRGGISTGSLRIKLFAFFALISVVATAAGSYSEPKEFGRSKADLESAAQVAQKKVVTGSVKDAKGLALPGVTVSVKGTSTGTISNADGTFKLSLGAEAKTLAFTFIGMKPRNCLKRTEQH